MGESKLLAARTSNLQGGKFAPKKIRPVDKRISFRDLAKFAIPHKTEQFLVDHTGCDESTAKRWLRGRSRAPGEAVCAIFADIFARIE